MKPAIVYHKTNPTWRHLVDLNSVFVMPDKDQAEERRHFAAAIGLQDLKPGYFRPMTADNDSSLPRQDGSYADKSTPPNHAVFFAWRARRAHPFPCVYQMISEPQKILFTAEHGGEQTPDGITRSASIALLRLARSYNAVRPDYARDKWRFCKPAKEGTTTPWDEWKFLTAWMWSKWELSDKRVTKRDRWRAMKALGYPNGERAFSAMTAELFG